MEATPAVAAVAEGKPIKPPPPPNPAEGPGSRPLVPPLTPLYAQGRQPLSSLPAPASEAGPPVAKPAPVEVVAIAGPVKAAAEAESPSRASPRRRRPSARQVEIMEQKAAVAAAEKAAAEEKRLKKEAAAAERAKKKAAAAAEKERKKKEAAAKAAAAPKKKKAATSGTKAKKAAGDGPSKAKPKAKAKTKAAGERTGAPKTKATGTTKAKGTKTAVKKAGGAQKVSQVTTVGVTGVTGVVRGGTAGEPAATGGDVVMGEAGQKKAGVKRKAAGDGAGQPARKRKKVAAPLVQLTIRLKKLADRAVDEETIVVNFQLEQEKREAKKQEARERAKKRRLQKKLKEAVERGAVEEVEAIKAQLLPPAAGDLAGGEGSQSGQGDASVAIKKKKPKQSEDQWFSKFLGNCNNFYSQGYVDGYDDDDPFIDDSEFRAVNPAAHGEDDAPTMVPKYSGFYVHSGPIEYQDVAPSSPGAFKRRSSAASKRATQSPLVAAEGKAKKMRPRVRKRAKVDSKKEVKAAAPATEETAVATNRKRLRKVNPDTAETTAELPDAFFDDSSSATGHTTALPNTPAPAT